MFSLLENNKGFYITQKFRKAVSNLTERWKTWRVVINQYSKLRYGKIKLVMGPEGLYYPSGEKCDINIFRMRLI